MANPLPIAAVVFPSSSSESVMSLTSLPIPDISAIPPALSATGPYASIAIVIPTVASIPTAAIPTPYTPSTNDVEANIIAASIIIGITTDCIPTDKPEIITVADPVSPDSAIFLTGLPPV